ncbi:DUF6731 family protein [Alkalihalobacillus sp. LMS39]|uniref:DUF6731 family protein n=1 Tax=Alkalihalobacillus sp. LMS39 TaxID=2924032 RepID=UPI001FB436F7|nr:DUF6731 family protein [Alkalihalobacillus sp. LMS39]UOE96044.1 hypothetical protein MM271_10785 [Alkalihalobacillus sp. LMS39]
MPTTVQFFNCFLSKNGDRTNVSISDFLDGVISLEENVRFIENKYGSYSLIDMFMPNQNPNNNSLDRIVGFANYRDKKPFVGTRGRDERAEITGDVLELTTCMFIPTYHLAIIEYNHFGARPMHIEQYLNSFLPKVQGEAWQFELIPIETPASFREIRSSGDIRNIEIKLDLLSTDVGLFTGEEMNPQSISYRILHESYQAYRELGANVATLSLGQGRHRSNPMEFDSLISLLQVLDLQSDIFASVKVKYYNPNTRKVTTADLKNDGLLKKVILENNNSTAFESVGIGISKYYYEQSNRLANSEWRNQVTELIAADLPVIRPNNWDETE